jgi:hypothetical protein
MTPPQELASGRGPGNRPGRGPGRPAAVLAVVTAAVALLGVPAGAAWIILAPRVVVVITGHGAAQVVNPETKAFIAGDGWFCVIGLAGGLLTGVVGYLLAVRRHGAPAMAGLILGGLAAALIAWWIGRSSGLAAFHAALLTRHTGAVLHAPLVLRAHTAVVIWPLTTALCAGLAELLRGQASSASPIGATSKLGA